MAIKRASRAGQIHSFPLLCDPLYQERRIARIVSAGDGLPEAEARIAMGRERVNIEAEESVFTASLDDSALRIDLDGVSRAAIRGLRGSDFAAIQERAAIRVAKARIDDAESRNVRSHGELMLATIEAALVSSGVDGLPVVEVAPYPLAELYGPGGVGSLWPTYAQELHERIITWSTLGESAGSSPALSSDAPPKV